MIDVDCPWSVVGGHDDVHGHSTYIRSSCCTCRCSLVDLTRCVCIAQRGRDKMYIVHSLHVNTIECRLFPGETAAGAPHRYSNKHLSPCRLTSAYMNYT
ncbi:hypothetical protein BDV19DRAFT_368651 [Aspergillus venezuelensis]